MSIKQGHLLTKLRMNENPIHVLTDDILNPEPKS